MDTGQNLEEHVERSEKHFARPEQVKNAGGGGMLFHDHVLADGSRLQKVVWKLPVVTLCHSLCFDLCLRNLTRSLPDYLILDLALKDFRFQNTRF